MKNKKNTQTIYLNDEILKILEILKDEKNKNYTLNKNVTLGKLTSFMLKKLHENDKYILNELNNFLDEE